MPNKHNQPRRHKIPKAKYRGSNWREYDRALQQRGRLAMWVTPEALEAGAPAKTGRRGRPSAYSDIAIVTDQVDPDHLGLCRSCHQRFSAIHLCTSQIMKRPTGFLRNGTS